MYKFGKVSQQRLATCHPDLQRLFNEVIKEINCSIICGHRTAEEQEKAFKGGFSKVQFPNSKHNQMPSLAVDVAPYPIDWNDVAAFERLAEVVKRKAKELNIKVIWGGDWKRFVDRPHWELGRISC